MPASTLRFIFVSVCSGVLASLRGSEPIAVVRMVEGERMVHIVASPFTHEYYLPRLEAMLLHRYAPFGLKYRRVQTHLAELAGNLDALVLLHRPTLVMIQTGNWDLVRQRHYEFAEFPRHLEHVVAALTEKRIRVIVCSPIPVGSESRKGRLVFPVAELGGWVEAARQTAARHGAHFVDLFSDAIEWMTPGSTRATHFYTAEQHQKSFELLRRQLRFEPAGSTVTADAKARTVSLNRARVRDLAWEGRGLTLTMEPMLGEGSASIRIVGLAPGNYSVAIDQASLGTRPASDLEQGLELGSRLEPPPDLRALKAELDLGQELAAALSRIHGYALPGWLTLDSLGRQKNAALNEVARQLAQHDSRLAELVRPQPMRIQISAAPPLAGRPEK